MIYIDVLDTVRFSFDLDISSYSFNQSMADSILKSSTYFGNYPIISQTQMMDSRYFIDLPDREQDALLYTISRGQIQVALMGKMRKIKEAILHNLNNQTFSFSSFRLDFGKSADEMLLRREIADSIDGDKHIDISKHDESVIRWYKWNRKLIAYLDERNDTTYIEMNDEKSTKLSVYLRNYMEKWKGSECLEITAIANDLEEGISYISNCVDGNVDHRTSWYDYIKHEHKNEILKRIIDIIYNYTVKMSMQAKRSSISYITDKKDNSYDLICKAMSYGEIKISTPSLVKIETAVVDKYVTWSNLADAYRKFENIRDPHDLHRMISYIFTKEMSSSHINRSPGERVVFIHKLTNDYIHDKRLILSYIS